ncbi:MAG: glutamate--cysteine ligase [Francisellaceae bacterium]
MSDYKHLRGIERESLRMNGDQLARSMHPQALGSKLTNAHITVDFAESQLELITAPSSSVVDAFLELKNLTAFTLQNMPESEFILNASMPLSLKDDDINIACFGESNSGRMKEIYRKGLALRYGKIMQTISGLHYNFSFDPQLLERVANENGLDTNAQYFSLINHFFEYMWLLPYFFGASPICAKSSVMIKPDYLSDFDDNSYLGEFATSLRMSDLGYQSPAQDSLFISYRGLKDYVHDLVQATKTRFAPFANFGLYDGEHKRQQLNEAILQTESEYYSSIRPKQVARRCERPACALMDRGVSYLEVRLLDINPFVKNGIDRYMAYFVEALLMTCLLNKPVEYCRQRVARNRENLSQVVKYGRMPGFQLAIKDHSKLSLAEYGMRLLDDIEAVAMQMGDDYAHAVSEQRQKLGNPDKTRSAEVVIEATSCGGYDKWILKQSRAFSKSMRQYPIPRHILQNLQREAEDSHVAEQMLEKSSKDSITDYIDRYYRSAKDCVQGV